MELLGFRESEAGQVLSAGTASTATNPECVSVDRRGGAEIPVGWRSEDLGEWYIGVYACDCCVKQSLRSEVPTFKGRKMGQTASAELAELTECVIDPPQNVSKNQSRMKQRCYQNEWR